MTDSNLIELAKLGDPQAIAALMNQSLESRGMRATVDRQGDCLEVMLEAERIPNRQSLTAFVQKGINNLGIQTITSIRILGQQFGASYPAWMQELRLDGFPDPEIGTTPLPIQSETAIDSPPIPNEPVLPSRAADFSVTGSMNLDAAVDAKSLSDSAELNELWSPSEEPDFLRELLATESVPADLSNQSISDETTTTDADGLIDFLNDLSGETAQEEFPAEAVQEQSSFMAGIDGSESANFQDLFAESGELTNGLSDSGLSDSGLSEEMGNLAWEESGEPIAGGEPDADLLNFLNTPDEPLTVSTEFTPPDEQILADYPDALSIDQLPEDLLSEANAPEASLEEPPEDFLSTLLGEPLDPPTPDAMPDADEAIAEPLINPPDQEPIAEPLADPILQDPWAIDPVGEPVAEPEPMAQSEFPEEMATESTPFSAASSPEESDLEEALPDFLVEPMLDLPEADPAEMTLSELEQQPEVLDAAVEETIDESSQFPPDEPQTLASLVADDQLADDQSEDTSDSFSLVEDSSTDMALESEPEEVAASVELSPEEIEPEAASSDEVPPQSFPDATLLSSFADSQTDTAFWEDSEEEVEEIPPDFLLEMESWETVEPESPTPDSIVDFPADFPADSAALPTEAEQPLPTLADETPEFEELTSPDPEWSALEAQLSNLDLASDPQAAAPEIDTDLALELESPDPEGSIDPLGMEAIEPLSDTPEGTAIEPPTDWVASASPVDTGAEPSTEFSPSEFSPSAEIEAMNAEFSDSVPEESSANGIASELDTRESDLREDAGEPDADPPTPLPDLSQDELEAGLGDFRAGFVEPLPPEFFETDEPQPGYSDWQADLREPLSLDEDDESGYIIEDSTPDIEYTPPPLPVDPDVRSSNPSSPSGIFVMVLFALCAFLGMLGGYVLFKSRLTPQPSNVPPPAEPPAEPVVPESPAPASPTSANPVDPIANQAIDRAFAAVLLGPIAQSDADWQRIDHEWQQAIALAQASNRDRAS